MKLSFQIDPKFLNTKQHSISFKGDKSISKPKELDSKKPMRKFNYLSQIKSTSSSFRSSTFLESNMGSGIWEMRVNKGKKLRAKQLSALKNQSFEHMRLSPVSKGKQASATKHKIYYGDPILVDEKFK